MLTLQPAYGRDYKSQAAVKADWNANKDFIIASIGPDCGRYVNKADHPGKVSIRYQRNTKVVILDMQQIMKNGKVNLEQQKLAINVWQLLMLIIKNLKV